MSAIIYHNPRCSKSRQALELLNNNLDDNNIKVIEYLKTVLKASEIKKLSKLTKLPIRQLLRSKEQAYRDNNLNDPALSETDIINTVIENPILLERPIVIVDSKAKICRPPELVLELI